MKLMSTAWATLSVAASAVSMSSSIERSSKSNFSSFFLIFPVIEARSSGARDPDIGVRRRAQSPHDRTGAVPLLDEPCQIRVCEGHHVEFGIEAGLDTLDRRHRLDEQDHVVGTPQAVSAEGLEEVVEHLGEVDAVHGHADELVHEFLDVAPGATKIDLVLVDVGQGQGAVHDHLGVVLRDAVDEFGDRHPGVEVNVTDHAAVDEDDSPSSLDEHVPRMRIGVEEAHVERHLEDGAGAVLDEPPAGLVRQIDGCTRERSCSVISSTQSTCFPVASQYTFGKSMPGSSANAVLRFSVERASWSRSTSRSSSVANSSATAMGSNPMLSK